MCYLAISSSQQFERNYLFLTGIMVVFPSLDGNQESSPYILSQRIPQ